MTGGARRRFSVSAPDWGHTHLSPDAVVAFVDDELAHGPHERAVAEVTACPECAAEVAAQRQARFALRSAACPGLPSSLLSSLRSIPQDAELPGPPPGLAMSADGQLVSALRPEPVPERPAGAEPAEPPGRSRRMRFGAGAAMSGLALGAIAFGVSALAGEARPYVPAPAADRGVLGGPVLSGASEVVEAGLDSGQDPGLDARQGAAWIGRSGAGGGTRFADVRGGDPMTYLRIGPR